MEDAPEQDARHRAGRALRTTLVLTASAALFLGVLGVGLAVLVGPGPSDPWPGVSVFAVGQLAAVAAAGSAALGLHRLSRAADPAATTARVRRLMSRLALVLVVTLPALALGWVVVRPDEVVAVVAATLVSLQVAALLHALRR